jgi:DNA invertase Pin-like site-specific DNA recombinase
MTTQTPRKAAIYCRMSLDQEGSGLGVQRQEEACRAWAAARGWSVSNVYVDNDLSGSKASVKRPGYEGMLRAVALGEHDAVVSWALDRLSRQTRQTLDLMELCQARGVPIGTCQGDLDLTTPQGRTMALLAARFAQQEVEVKGERQKAANTQRVMGGEVYGRKRLLGWLDLACTQVDPVAGPKITTAIQDVLKGVSVREIARAWNLEGFLSPGGYPWKPATLAGVLKRPANAGIVEYRGVEHREVEPRWTPLVSREDFDAMKAVLAARGSRNDAKPSRAARRYLMSQVAVCGNCGSTFNGNEQRSGLNYICTGGTLSHHCYRAISVASLDKVATDYTVNRLSWLTADSLLSATDVAKRKEFTDQLGSLEVERAQIAASDLSLASRLAMLGDVDKREAAARQGLMSAQTGSVLVDLLIDLVSPRTGSKVSIERMASNRAALRDRFDGLSLSQRKMLVSSFGRYTVLDRSAGSGADRVTIEDLYPLGEG